MLTLALREIRELKRLRDLASKVRFGVELKGQRHNRLAYRLDTGDVPLFDLGEGGPDYAICALFILLDDLLKAIVI